MSPLLSQSQKAAHHLNCNSTTVSVLTLTLRQVTHTQSDSTLLLKPTQGKCGLASPYSETSDMNDYPRGKRAQKKIWAMGHPKYNEEAEYNPEPK